MGNGTKLLAGFGLVVVVIGVVALKAGKHEGPDPKERPLLASKALTFSEELVWTLEGECLKDAARVLAEADARSIASSAEGIEGGAQRIETRLREYLRVRRHPNVWKNAEKAFVTMTPESRKATNDAAIAAGLRPVDILAEWMTTEGATDLHLMTKVHSDRKALRDQLGAVVDTFFAEGAPAPSADKGVKVVSRTDEKIVVDLFGATVIEEVFTAKAEVIGDDKVKIVWKSNYSFLRDVVRGKKPGETIDDTLVKSDEGYGVEYQDYIAEFLKGADKQPWATILCTKGVAALGAELASKKTE